MGPYRIHPPVLSELADVPSRPNLKVLEMSQQLGELLGSFFFGVAEANVIPIFTKLFFNAILGS